MGQPEGIYEKWLGSPFLQIFLPLRSRKTSYIPNVKLNFCPASDDKVADKPNFLMLLVLLNCEPIKRLHTSQALFRPKFLINFNLNSLSIIRFRLYRFNINFKRRGRNFRFIRNNLSSPYPFSITTNVFNIPS